MNISMEPSELKSIAGKVVEDAGTYKNYITKVYNIVNAINGSWAGKDSQEYIKKVNSYKAEMDKLGKIIEEYGTFLAQVAKDYEKTQNEIRNAFK